MNALIGESWLSSDNAFRELSMVAEVLMEQCSLFRAAAAEHTTRRVGLVHGSEVAMKLKGSVGRAVHGADVTL